MANLLIAQRYARTLINLAVKKNLVDTIAADLTTLVQLYDDHKRLAWFLRHPRLASRAKYQLLEKMMKGRVQDLTLRFMELVLKKGRIEHLSAIRDNYNLQRDDLMGLQRVRVRTAFPLPDNSRSALQKQLNRLTGKETILSIELDRSLLGGVSVQIGDTVFEGSVRGRLNNLRNYLLSSIRSGTV